MQLQPKIIALLGLASAVSGCAIAPLAGGHQKNLDCPSDLDMYCGGWTVYASAVDSAVSHIVLNDQLVIGKRNNGTDPLAIFPRITLRGRWGNVDEIPLKEIESSGNHECMVGRVKIPTGDDHGVGGSSHEWHAITLRVEIETNGAIGDEEELKICMNEQTGGGWPNSCEPLECESDGDPRNHGGRAHARD